MLKKLKEAFCDKKSISSILLISMITCSLNKMKGMEFKMKKYNKELINQYINGEDIVEYSINELEGDKDFMIQVINISNDYRFYNLCSDEVKLDYEFIKYLILKFKENIKFICLVADEFLGKSEDDFAKTELTLIMRDLTKGDETKHIEYCVAAESMYCVKRLEVEFCKGLEKDEQFSEEIGMGFWFIFDLYNGSDIILNFYIGKIIKDIFSENELDLENLLHNNFKSKEEINDMGINNFIVRFIERYDPMLSSYLSANIGYLSELRLDIQKIQNNWENYNNDKEYQKYSEAIEQVYKYWDNYVIFDGKTSVEKIMYYVADELGIGENIRKYDYKVSDDVIRDLEEQSMEAMEDYYVEIPHCIDDLNPWINKNEFEIEEDIKTLINTDVETRKHYANVKRILIGVLFGDGSYQLIGDKTDNKKIKGRLLKLDFSQKNNQENN